mmetsp:Transcript_16766/g.33062  ORF Transcript_16766/g.33062 Transcript_16766/m.33062 type:complete len:128 (-) Transcript_16766:51-434(-)
MVGMRPLLLALLVAAAHAFTVPPAAVRTSFAAQLQTRRSAPLALRMQEQGGGPPKQTTGFGKIFGKLSKEVSLETEVDETTGKAKPKFTQAQLILLSALNFVLPVVIYKVFVETKGYCALGVQLGPC